MSKSRNHQKRGKGSAQKHHERKALEAKRQLASAPFEAAAAARLREQLAALKEYAELDSSAYFPVDNDGFPVDDEGAHAD